jgi:para-nitrobenzyl esterase
MGSRHRSGARAKINRRVFLGSSAAAAGWFASGPFTRGWAQDIRLAKASHPVDTQAGRVQGVVLDGGVNAFYGIPYGASTGGENRFMPPQEPAPWSGTRETTAVGHRSPQDNTGPIPEVYALDRREPMGEDCLNLNVFTPALGRGDRPVMVWLHGGGYSSGSGNWLLYDGARLARSQDAVVVPVTHRLNVFGYMYLAELGGEKYAESSNLGMLDIIQALAWVRDNIERFGGDPNNVTIFGQSGGGGKVSTLMGMPDAQGLFHRAIAMSGAQVGGLKPDAASESAERFMKALGVDSVDAMQGLPMERLRSVASSTQRLALSPVLDGRTLPAGPFEPAASPLSANVPMMLSTTEHEVNFFPFQPLDPMDDAQLVENVKRSTRATDAEVKDLIALYRKHRPDVGNTELNTIIGSDNTMRPGVLTEAERKAQQGTAPVYMYYFRWQSPVREGKLRAYHTVDIPFAFNNVEVCASMVGAGQARYPLATRVSAAFASFARRGDPNHDGLPHWPTFDPKQRATMEINNEPRVVDDPYGEERRALAELREKHGGGSLFG